MNKANRHYKSGNGIIMRLFTFVLLSIVVPLAIRIIKKKLIENNKNLLCYKCQRKLEKINKNEFYCKNCKIIRIDNNNT